MENFKGYRHGDVSLHATTSIPKGLKKVALKLNQPYIIRHGETGHKHVITPTKENQVEIYEGENGMHYLKVNEPVSLTHEEHKELVIEKGMYIQKQEVEYNPFTQNLRQVID